MNKELVRRLLSAAIVVALPACIHAADTTNFADGIAEAKKENRDVLVYFTGSDWCPPAVKFKAGILDAGDVRQKLDGQFIVAVIDRPATASPEQIEADKKQNKALEIVPRNYPEIVLSDNAGRAYAQIDCRLDAPKTPAALLKKIEVALDSKAKRDTAFAEAEKLSGPDKALALGRGLDALAPDVAGTYKAEIDVMKKADPEDKSGYVAKYTFHANTFLEREVLKPVADKKPEDAARAIAKMLANDKLTLDQKMYVRAAKVAFFKEQKKQPEMIAALRETVAASPAHDLAQGAQGYLDFLEKPVTLPDGKWNNPCCRNPGIWLVDVSDTVKTPGRYQVVMEHLNGSDRQRVSNVALVAGDKVLAAKKTDERVGPDNKRLAWEFDVPEVPDGKIDVRLGVTCEGWWWHSEGRVSVQKCPPAK